MNVLKYLVQRCGQNVWIMGKFSKEIKAILKMGSDGNAKHEKHNVRDEEFLRQIVNKLDTTEEKISELEDRSIEIIHTNIKWEKQSVNKTQELWNNTNCPTYMKHGADEKCE